MAARANSSNKTATARQKSKQQEYYAWELVENCHFVFGSRMSRECVEAALKTAGLEKTSITNAQKIIKEFLKREVI